MENASKALLMAGSIMLTLLVLTTFLYGFNIISENQKEREELKAMQELAKFNLQFTNFARDDVLGYELLSLVNKVIDYNQRFSKEGELTGSAAGNYFQYTPITLEISFIAEEADKSLFEELHETTRNEVNRPAVANDVNNIYKPEDVNERSLFDPTEADNLFVQDDFLFKYNEKNTNGIYTQNDTVDRFQDILDIISSIEEEYTKEGAQNLTKTISTIFEGKVIGYNGQPIDDIEEKKKWFEKNYIEERFKSLTGKNLGLEGIRANGVVKKILQYSEYMQFKKASFECYNVEYDELSQRVSKLSFRYTGEDLK